MNSTLQMIISDELKAFLQYLVDKIPRDEFTKKLDAEVNHIRASYERRLEYMTLYDKYEEIREEGRIEGRIEGREESIPIFAKTLAELGLNENEILAQVVQKFEVEMAQKRQQEILQEFNCNSYEELQQLLNAKEVEMQKLIDSANAYLNKVLPIINEVESLTQVL